jgi:hypothetical protein
LILLVPEVSQKGECFGDGRFAAREWSDDPATSGYIFNLQTKGLARGVYQLALYVGSDPTVCTVQFQIR